RALIGSDFALRLVDEQGRVLASVQTPAEVWGVVASGDGRLAVAALGDGTLRWYSLNGGVRPLEELAVLFPHGGGRQWVLWTPEALFDHSDDGGQELVGFHFNNTKKTAPQWVEFKRVYEVLFNREMVRDRLRQVNRDALTAKVQRIGDLRALTQRAPKLTLVDYCVVQRDTRGVSRVAPANQQGAVSAPVENCRPIDTSPLTRAFSRVSAAATAAPGAGGDAGGPRSVLDLPEDAGAVRIRYKLEAAGDGVGDVQVFHNDRDVTGSGTRGFSRVSAPGPASAPSAAPETPAAQELREALVRVEPGSNRVTLRAYNSNGAIYEQSPVVEFALAAPTRAAEPAEPPPPPAKPRLIYIAAGIDAYQPPFPRLQRAATDARTFAKTLRERMPDAYDAAESIKLSHELYDGDASRMALIEALSAVAREAREEDTVVIYLAGHGVVDPLPEDNVDLYYFITQNVAGGDTATVAREALSERDAMKLLRDIPARNKVLLLDTCHSGAVQEFTNYAASKIEKLKERVGRGPYILAAAAGDQTALDSSADRSRSGPFARAVIEALAETKGEPGETVDQIQLARYIRAKVPVYAQQDRWNQTAVVSFGGGDVDFFPVAQVK
ncbi:caspase family protein, partial [Azospirillum sp. RWY-5-1]